MNRNVNILFFVFYLFYLIDYITTKIGLSIGLVEKNEITKWFIENNIFGLHLLFSAILLYLTAYGIIKFIDKMEEKSKVEQPKKIWITFVSLLYILVCKETILSNINLILQVK